jgi:predicted AAA+ superfamily ATPase
MPVVLLAGARQTGKTTLMESIIQNNGYSYITFDDEFSLANARHDPSGWLLSVPKPVIIDEVQRVPEIFLPIKRDVDLNRKPGRYLLTGSANPLLLPKLGDSLAGRMGIVTLFPFSQGEILGVQEQFVPWIFSEEFPVFSWDILKTDDLHRMFLRGGFPVVQNLKKNQDVQLWIRSYLQTMMERDIYDISHIGGIHEFPRLFRLLATRSGKILNTSDVSRTLGMVNMTISRYLRLLETLYFIHLLPAWFTNKGKRLIKSPKLHFCDTGVLAQLLDVDHDQLRDNPLLAGQFLENFVFTELIKLRSWSKIPFEVYHFRDGDYEVDFVLEGHNGKIIGLEVKSAKTISSQDLKGLKHLQALSKNHFLRGIVLYTGNTMQSLGSGLWAVPLQALWQQ